MSSVQDADGTWWKRCMECRDWTAYEELRYEAPTDQYPYGRDLCPSCGATCPPNELITIQLPRPLEP